MDDLNHLFRGGRLSRTSAIAGTLLGIKPVLYTSMDGARTVGSKVRGRQASLLAMIDRMVTNIDNPEGQTLIINHADCLKDAQFMAEEIRRRVTVKDILILPLGPVIGSHVGPGCIALFFTGRTREW